MIHIQNAVNESSENAIRHTLWLALATRDFGSNHARRMGYANESYVNYDMTQIDYETLQTVFLCSEEADTLVDLLNNEIGIRIGGEDWDLINREMAEKVIEAFRDEGLWVVFKSDFIGDEHYSYTIKRHKISQEEYSSAIKAIDEINKAKWFIK